MLGEAAYPVSMLAVVLVTVIAAGVGLAFRLASARSELRALRVHNENLQATLDTMSQGVALFDAHERILFSNARYATMYGMDVAEVAPGRSLRSILEARFRRGVYAGTTVDAILERLRQRLARKEVTHWTAPFADGRTIVVSTQPRPDGSWVNTHLDITEREKLREQLDAALSSIIEGIAMFDGEQRLIVANRQYADIYKLPHDQVRAGKSLREILEVGVAAGTLGGGEIADFNASCAFLDDGQKVRRHRIALRDGRFVDVTVTTTVGGGIVTSHRDVTEQCIAEARIAHMALHDTLTGLANRVLMKERLEHAIARAKRGEEAAALLLLDLDHFKKVNDTLGHPVGDALLQQVAQRLNGVVRATDTAARLGGDEFAIVQAGVSGPQDAATLADRVIKALSAPYQISGHNVVIGTSVGIAIADGADFDSLMHAADVALYRSKHGGRGRFCFFGAEMDEELRGKREFERDFHDAVQAKAFELHYQPLFSVSNSEISGFEALVRWRHPVRGLVSPAEFIPLAERSGLIHSLGEWVLREACTIALDWPSHLRIAVNVSPIQLRDLRIVEVVAGVLAETGLAPERLELEITESALIEGPASDVLRSLKALGLRLALDDFGVGFSSLTTLQLFRFDRIKIDRSFIRTAGDLDKPCVVRGLATLARALGLETTAEGVETEAQLDIARAEGCTEIQGFLFARPAPARDLACLLLNSPVRLRGDIDQRRVSAS